MIYIAGPISGEPLEVRLVEFAEAENRLKRASYEVLNPMRYPPICSGTCSGRKERPEDEHSRVCYLRWDLYHMLTFCNGVALLPGHETSAGATEEARIALYCGMQVWSIDAWLENTKW